MTTSSEITLIFLFVLCIGGIGERSSRKHTIFAPSSSHALRHSAKRHMLAHVENGDNSSSIVIDYTKLYSDSLIQPFASIKAESNHTTTSSLTTESISDSCQTNAPCYTLSGSCIKCTFNYSCIYGEDTNITCEAINAKCTGNRTFIKTHVCRYCYQTPSHEHTCQRNTSCHVVSAPRQRYVTKCTVKPHVLCLGNKNFAKHVPCNWTKGYSWGTALLLSIVFGGFGVDRFYLGMWQEGIGKLFSFGGLGVWTLIDVILIATGYLGPADHSLYIRN
ncbi:TM2 domain-containing protein 3-like [Argiope bruennichi]|uniref:TM2 domain-containing protein almondex n=1 Tax=Argiope bruennichi TaxID=94029 RepID=A0A8T0FXM1_ARGBR|nr:TM2 domain-containing protein 3-like [Argiope bruennichi]KAF8795005.1 TM2 domain-containing protein almondex [Argiope bruennichi]